jgi:hypothetical protein
MLLREKYSEKFQIKMWSTYYHVYDYLVKKGRLESKKIFPIPIVDYFLEWKWKNRKRCREDEGK